MVQVFIVSLLLMASLQHCPPISRPALATSRTTSSFKDETTVDIGAHVGILGHKWGSNLGGARHRCSGEVLRTLGAMVTSSPSRLCQYY
eukprot:1143291-Pelagomonas_calceolata.AAC.6